MKKVSSVVWQFFDRLEEDKRCVAVLCKLCDTEYKYFGNTTNLRGHLMKKHPIQWELRQVKWDGQKPGDSSSVNSTFEDDDSTQSSIPVKHNTNMKKEPREKNVRFALSIKDDGLNGESTMPKIEIQRVDLLENDPNELDNMDVEVNDSMNLVQQMHDTQGSDEEWLEEDFHELYSQKNMKNLKYKKIKREVHMPSRRLSYKNEHFNMNELRKDEYSVFGEYIANKLRKFKSPRTRGNIQQLITTILWQAEYGYYDDAETVKRVLMSTVQSTAPETSSDLSVHVEQYTMEHEHDMALSTMSEVST